MFTPKQILTPTYLIRNFNKVADRISENEEIFLLMRKNGDKYVLLAAEEYYELVRGNSENKAVVSLDRNESPSALVVKV